MQSYEKNIADIKKDYTKCLTNIMVPFIYEGIKSCYNHALLIDEAYTENGKYNLDEKSPGILKLFQLCLKEIATLNNNSIEIETNRIKSCSKCANWFEPLVRATIKSHIVLYTFTHPNRVPDILKEKFHEKVDIKDFVHKCYIESAKTIYNNPELFWHEYPSLEIKRNQRITYKILHKAIEVAIINMLPMEVILKEYLSSDYTDIENDLSNNMSQYENIKALLERENMAFKNNSNKHKKYSSSSSSTESSKSSKSSKSKSSYVSTDNSTSSSTSNDDTNTSKSSIDEEDEYNKNKDFLKEIESQLHVVDNNIKTVNNFKNDSHNESPKKEIMLGDLFEKAVESNKPIEPPKIPEIQKLQPMVNQIKKINQENKISSNKQPQPPVVNEPPQFDIDNFMPPKKLSKKDKMYMAEIEEQINANINNIA